MTGGSRFPLRSTCRSRRGKPTPFDPLPDEQTGYPDRDIPQSLDDRDEHGGIGVQTNQTAGYHQAEFLYAERAGHEKPALRAAMLKLSIMTHSVSPAGLPTT